MDHKSLPVYLMTTFTYGAARKALQINGVQKQRATKSDKSDMLLGTKIGLVCASGAISSVVWPTYVMSDFNMFECKLRGYDSAFFGYHYTPKTIFDYLFM